MTRLRALYARLTAPPPPPRPDLSPFDPVPGERKEAAHSRARVRFLFQIVDGFAARGLLPDAAVKVAVEWLTRPVDKEQVNIYGEEER